ncbi:hypothetical protein N7462_008627 [Penicillium macrosclerotiorum]|uniref:uncharacterized protein n=1 Tax=Penicillium macrosclerotiorum TaxID=303699 RepID=UPI002548577B|nr:uncharacterized protein N7462_008627 [Penicillium macrosclerotiorum]KAJ5675730.1 hypothetical protein N7462_008627 [Penicillium macrosclerotiorum]
MPKPTRQAQGQNRKKVKSGFRRVKCDESRPACRRCVSTGRVCDGYGIWGGGGTPYGPPQANRALSIYRTPVPAGSLTHEEQAYFDWFMEKTTKKFAGLFNSDFWETLVFQASAQEPAVRHAVVALSAAHRFDRNYGPWTIPATYGFDAEKFTLQQYNKAIINLRKTTASTKKNALRVALITCMLFVTLEYLRGQYKMGSAHLRYGIKLLSNISTTQPRLALSPIILNPAEDFALNALIDSYARLAIQSAMFGHVPSELCVVTCDPQNNALPYKFSSVLDARRRLDDLLIRSHCLKRHLHNLKMAQQPTDDPEIFEIRQRILNDLSLWRKAYHATVTLLEEESEPCKDRFGYLLLSAYYEMCVIMTSVSLSSEGELVFESYIDNFVAILTGFDKLWEFWRLQAIQTKEWDEILKSAECGGHGFTVESGFIPPVYYTALKCRVPRIRRYAIRMLRSVPHREGVWNGPLLADVLEEVMRAEEGNLFDRDKHVNELDLALALTEEDRALPNVESIRRVIDVTIILPDSVRSDTFVTYKQQIEKGVWETFRKKVGPGKLRGQLDLNGMQDNT